MVNENNIFQSLWNDSSSDFPVHFFSDTTLCLKAAWNFLTQLQIAVKKYFHFLNEIDYIIAFCNRSFIVHFWQVFLFLLFSLLGISLNYTDFNTDLVFHDRE